MCAPKDFAPSAIVDTLRVLAIAADKSFAAPDEDVALDALVADPLGNGRDVAFAYATCVNPGSAEVPDCAAHVGAWRMASVADGHALFSVHVPRDALANAPPELPIGSVGVVYVVCAGDIVATAQPGAPRGCSRGNQPVSREGFQWGEKRITVVSGVRNKNPDIARVFFDRHRWDDGFPMEIDPCPPGDLSQCPADKEHALDVELVDGAAEMFAGRTEDVVTFFLVSQGSLRDEVVRSTDVYETIWAPTNIDASRSIEFWFVVRDDRGGVSFAHRTANVR